MVFFWNRTEGLINFEGLTNYTVSLVSIIAMPQILTHFIFLCAGNGVTRSKQLCMQASETYD